MKSEFINSSVSMSYATSVIDIILNSRQINYDCSSYSENKMQPHFINFKEILL